MGKEIIMFDEKNENYKFQQLQKSNFLEDVYIANILVSISKISTGKKKL